MLVVYGEYHSIPGISKKKCTINQELAKCKNDRMTNNKIHLLTGVE
jgi:hypothetical protein